MRVIVLSCCAALVAGAAFADLFVVGGKASESDYPFYGC
jgi:hypothetical protein